ncbi:MAG: F0F1 ATP synthase subunit delta [Archangium sp.]|nr:F0F1 ATP synthase subunit delta [Archangium sp.]MDP3574182.1 F0F1 ATP synthase subunit delta [Archangium sp.]
MLIDWFTVGAQVLNFALLVFLMRRFLYKPILAAIAAREKKIAAELADADAQKAEAGKERDDLRQKNESFDQERAALMSEARDEAKAERQRLLAEARKAAEALSAKRQETLANEATQLNGALVRKTQAEVFAIARKTLTDLATVSLEERVGEVFTRRLRELKGEAKERLGASLKSQSSPAIVRSAFELPPEQRAAIQQALNETFSSEVRIRFEAAPDLVSGIELSTEGQKLAWSIADYLSTLEKAVAQLLKDSHKPPAAKPKPEPTEEPIAEAKRP